jgi:hypothetical protein
MTNWFKRRRSTFQCNNSQYQYQYTNILKLIISQAVMLIRYVQLQHYVCPHLQFSLKAKWHWNCSSLGYEICYSCINFCIKKITPISTNNKIISQIHEKVGLFHMHLRIMIHTVHIDGENLVSSELSLGRFWEITFMWNQKEKQK